MEFLPCNPRYYPPNSQDAQVPKNVIDNEPQSNNNPDLHDYQLTRDKTTLSLGLDIAKEQGQPIWIEVGEMEVVNLFI